MATNILSRDLACDIGKVIEIRERANYEEILVGADRACFVAKINYFWP